MHNWPVLKQVLAAYKDKDVAGILHIFPLPYVPLHIHIMCLLLLAACQEGNTDAALAKRFSLYHGDQARPGASKIK